MGKSLDFGIKNAYFWQKCIKKLPGFRKGRLANETVEALARGQKTSVAHGALDAQSGTPSRGRPVGDAQSGTPSRGRPVRQLPTQYSVV